MRMKVDPGNCSTQRPPRSMLGGTSASGTRPVPAWAHFTFGLATCAAPDARIYPTVVRLHDGDARGYAISTQHQPKGVTQCQIRLPAKHCGKVIYFSPRLKKWVTHRVSRPNRDKIIETWKCGNDPAFPGQGSLSAGTGTSRLGAANKLALHCAGDNQYPSWVISLHTES